MPMKKMAKNLLIIITDTSSIYLKDLRTVVPIENYSEFCAEYHFDEVVVLEEKVPRIAFAIFESLALCEDIKSRGFQ